MKISKIAIDTNVILSIIIKRNNTQKALAILSDIQIKYDEIYLPKQVIAEVVYVLEGIHKYMQTVKKLSKNEIKSFIFSILNTPKFICEDKVEIIEALNLYTKKNITFGDALITSNILANGINEILSFDEDFCKVEGLKVYPK